MGLKFILKGAAVAAATLVASWGNAATIDLTAYDLAEGSTIASTTGGGSVFFQPSSFITVPPGIPIFLPATLSYSFTGVIGSGTGFDAASQKMFLSGLGVSANGAAEVMNDDSMFEILFTNVTGYDGLLVRASGDFAPNTAGFFGVQNADIAVIALDSTVMSAIPLPAGGVLLISCLGGLAMLRRKA